MNIITPGGGVSPDGSGRAAAGQPGSGCEKGCRCLNMGGTIRVAGGPTLGHRPGDAVILHRIWVDGTEFRWTRDVAAEGRTPHVGQEAPDNAGAKFAREELEVHDDGAVEAIQALDSVPLLHRQQTFVIRHHVCGAERQRWGRLQWGDGVQPDQ